MLLLLLQWKVSGGDVLGVTLDSLTAVPTAIMPTPLDAPHSLAIDKDTNSLYCVDKNNHRIVVLSATGAVMKCIGGGKRGQFGAQMNRPWGIDVAGSPVNTIFVTDRGNNTVKVCLGTRCPVEACSCFAESIV